MKVADEEKAKRDRIIDDYKQVKTWPFIVLKSKSEKLVWNFPYQQSRKETHPHHFWFSEIAGCSCGCRVFVGIPIQTATFDLLG